MGTWDKPTTKVEQKKLTAKLLKLRKLFDEVQGLVGDDRVYDGFQMAIDGLERFCTHLTPDCTHPAFYQTTTSASKELAPGVCSNCRLNVDET